MYLALLLCPEPCTPVCRSFPGGYLLDILGAGKRGKTGTPVLSSEERPAGKTEESEVSDDDGTPRLCGREREVR